VSARLARLALALYPLAYRRRYGEEMAALVEDQGATPRAIADLARGALRAHLRPEPSVAAALGRDERRRLALGAMLLWWVLFALVGLAFYKTTEGPSFEGSGAPGLLGPAHLGIEILAGIGSLAVVLGAAPLVLAALRQAGARPEARRAALLAGGCAAVFVAATAGLVGVANGNADLGDGLDALVLALWTATALACGIGCALAARRGLFAIAAPPRALRLAAACASVVAAAIAGIAVLTLVYAVDLVVAATDLAATPNGPFGNPDVRVSLVIQLAAMFALAVPACLSAMRSRRPGAVG
jgi:hypothetical protein